MVFFSSAHFCSLKCDLFILTVYMISSKWQVAKVAKVANVANVDNKASIESVVFGVHFSKDFHN